MGFWLVDADVLARSRFALSPVLETVAAMVKLANGEVPPWERSWLAEHRAPFLARVAGDRFARAFIGDVLPGPWMPDFMTLPPRSGRVTFDSEIARVRRTPAAKARADLVVAADPLPLPNDVDVDDPAGALADLLTWVWVHAVHADWPRRRRVFQADVVSRTATISGRGLSAALDDLSPSVRWLGSGRLQINTQDRPPRDLAGAELVLVPTSSTRSFVAWDLPTSYAIAYPASGQLADPAGRNRSDLAAARRLLGPTRADLLQLLVVPTSTTQLVAITDLALGTIGHHLRVLLDSGLVERRRSGASVLYYRSRLGSALMHQTADV